MSSVINKDKDGVNTNNKGSDRHVAIIGYPEIETTKETFVILGKE